MVCVSERTVCSFEDCPIIRTCLSESQLPSHLREELQQLREALEAPPPTEAPPREGCPALRLQDTCVNQCQRDADCPVDHLCCSNGCGQVCRHDTRVYRAPKRGSCPRILSGSEESCDTGCHSDHDCPGLQKCCQSSCGMTCTTPCFHWLSTSSHWQLSQRCQSRRTARRRAVNKRLKAAERRRHQSSRRDLTSSSMSLRDILDLLDSV
ncbi:wap four-disulfide core domain protein 2 [Plakobranchus ocellatus]|uniref:Wap four-disulfide core domain protein 2 n=1 Tax=Plakobranchus ocellatus TaxID=259542 RepID=A0AAV4AG38_9GAST|nr:wap four-disulfide core domain protein 2 [Plakobranchus ocellatus]